MNATVFIASPLVGAGIGYITNWIAIKMLFRPLQPIRILGKEIPALQGVIPKRHKDLAKSIGRTVGEHLLTEDAFESVLQSAETREQVRLLVREAARSLQTEERTIEDLMTLVVPDPGIQASLYTQVSAVVTSWVLEAVRSEKTLDALQQMVEDFLRRGIREFADSDDYANMKFAVREYILIQLRNPIVAEQLVGWITARVEEWKQKDQTLGEWIPAHLIKRIKELLVAQGPEICQQLIRFLDSTETRTQISARIEQFFSRGFWMSMLGKLFADKDKITDQIMDQIAGFLQEPENQAMVVEKIEGVFDQMLTKRRSEFAAYVDDAVIVSVSDWIYAKVSAPAFVDSVLDNLEDLLIRKSSMGTGWNASRIITDSMAQRHFTIEGSGMDDVETGLDEAAATHEENATADHAVGSLARQVLTYLLHADFVAEGISQLVDGQLQTLRQREVRSFFTRLQMSVIEKAENGILDLLDYLHRNYVGKFLTIFNFERLVEDKVLSFDLLEMEAIVLEVMSVELKAVTNFGLYLGFLMGFVTPLFNLLMGG